MENGKNNQIIKIAEFQWFQVQTKVRQYVHQLMQPFQKKQIQDASKMADLKKQLAQNKQKVRQHSFLLSKSDAKPLYFTQIQKKMDVVMDALITLKGQYSQDIQNMKDKIKSYDQKMAKTQIILSITENERRARIMDKEQIMLKMQKQMKEIMQKLESQTSDIANFNVKFTGQMHKLQQKMNIVQNRQGTVEGSLKNVQNDQNILKNENFKLDAKISRQQTKLQIIQKKVKYLEDTNDVAKKFVALVQVIKNQFGFIQNYIDKYLPLFIQSQISDTLDSCITGHNRTKLCLYQEQIYSILNDKIIMQKYNQRGLQKNIQEYMNVIERIIVRNRKYVIKLKVDKIIHLSKTLAYDVHVQQAQKQQISFATGMETASITLSKNLQTQKVSQFNVPDEKVKQVIASTWKIIEQDFKNQLKQTLNISKQWLKQIQQTIDKRINQMQTKLQKIYSQIKKVETNNNLSNSYLEKQIDSISTIHKQINISYQEIRKTIKQLTHFSSIVNHLVIQDEIDRQGIALYGLRQNFKQKQQPNIALDTKCFGCSGFPASTLSAFKMACLAYNPSNVFVQGKLYKREQILEVATKILQGIKQSLRDQSKPNSSVFISPRQQIQTRGQQNNKTMAASFYQNLSNTNNNWRTIETPTKTVMLPNLSSGKNQKFSSKKYHGSGSKGKDNTTSEMFYY